MGDLDSIPGLGRCPRGGHGNLLQYFCLENPMNKGVWWATAQGVATGQTRLSDSAPHSQGLTCAPCSSRFSSLNCWATREGQLSVAVFSYWKHSQLFWKVINQTSALQPTMVRKLWWQGTEINWSLIEKEKGESIIKTQGCLMDPKSLKWRFFPLLLPVGLLYSLLCFSPSFPWDWLSLPPWPPTASPR